MRTSVTMPKDKLTHLVKTIYDLSSPQGMGFMRYDPAPMSDEDAAKVIQHYQDSQGVFLDYVFGRACKMFIRFQGGDLSISYPWYDHTPEQFVCLLNTLGVSVPSDLQ